MPRVPLPLYTLKCSSPLRFALNFFIYIRKRFITTFDYPFILKRWSNYFCNNAWKKDIEKVAARQIGLLPLLHHPAAPKIRFATYEHPNNTDETDDVEF